MARIQPRRKAAAKRESNLKTKPAKKRNPKATKTVTKKKTATPRVARTASSGKRAAVTHQEEPIYIQTDTEESEAESADSSVITVAIPHHCQPPIVSDSKEGRPQSQNGGQKGRRKQSFAVVIYKKPSPSFQNTPELNPAQQAAAPGGNWVDVDSVYWLVTPEPSDPEGKVCCEELAKETSPLKDTQLHPENYESEDSITLRLPTMMEEESEDEEADTSQRKSITPISLELEDPQLAPTILEVKACSHTALPNFMNQDPEREDPVLHLEGENNPLTFAPEEVQSDSEVKTSPHTALPIAMEEEPKSEDAVQHVDRENSPFTVQPENTQVPSDFEDEACCATLSVEGDLGTEDPHQAYQQSGISAFTLSIPDDTQAQSDIEGKTFSYSLPAMTEEDLDEEDTDRLRLAVMMAFKMQKRQAEPSSEAEGEACYPTVPMEEGSENEGADRSQGRSFSLALTLVAEDSQAQSDLGDVGCCDDFPMADFSEDRDSIDDQNWCGLRDPSPLAALPLALPEEKTIPQPELKAKDCCDDFPMEDASDSEDDDTNRSIHTSPVLLSLMLDDTPAQLDLEDGACCDDTPMEEAMNSEDIDHSQLRGSSPELPNMLDQTDAQSEFEDKACSDDLPMEGVSLKEVATNRNQQRRSSTPSSLVPDDTQAQSDLEDIEAGGYTSPMMIEAQVEDLDEDGANQLKLVKGDTLQVQQEPEDRSHSVQERSEDEEYDTEAQLDLEDKACGYALPIIMGDDSDEEGANRLTLLPDNKEAHPELEDRTDCKIQPVQDENENEETDDTRAQPDPDDKLGGNTLLLEEDSKHDDPAHPQARYNETCPTDRPLTIVPADDTLVQAQSRHDGKVCHTILPIEAEPEESDADLPPSQDVVTSLVEPATGGVATHSSMEGKTSRYALRSEKQLESKASEDSDQTHRQRLGSPLTPVPEEIVALDVAQDARRMAAELARERNKERIRLQRLKEIEKRERRRAKARAKYSEKKREREANLLAQITQQKANLEASKQQVSFSANGLLSPGLTPDPTNLLILPSTWSFSNNFAPLPVNTNEPTPEPSPPRCPYDLEPSFMIAKRSVQDLYPPSSDLHPLAISFCASLDTVQLRQQTFIRTECSPDEPSMLTVATTLALEGVVTLLYLAEEYAKYIDSSDELDDFQDGIDEAEKLSIAAIDRITEEGFAGKPMPDDAALVCDVCWSADCKKKRDMNMVVWMEKKRKWAEENPEREEAKDAKRVGAIADGRE